MSGQVTLRGPAPGDLGWIVAEHGRHYVSGEGFAPEFEAIVARILGAALETVAGRTRLWIAEIAGQGPAGSVLMSDEGTDARLRLFYVSESARGRGIGERLVRALIDEARATGFARVILSTHAEHEAACRLYARLGFTCQGSDRTVSFGRELTVQDWALAL